MTRQSVYTEQYLKLAQKNVRLDADLLDRIFFGPDPREGMPTLVFGHIQLLPAGQRMAILCYYQFVHKESRRNKFADGDPSVGISSSARPTGELVRLQAFKTHTARPKSYTFLRPGKPRKPLSNDVLLQYDDLEADAEGAKPSPREDHADVFVLLPWNNGETPDPDEASGSKERAALSNKTDGTPQPPPPSLLFHCASGKVAFRDDGDVFLRDPDPEKKKEKQEMSKDHNEHEQASLEGVLVLVPLPSNDRVWSPSTENGEEHLHSVKHCIGLTDKVSQRKEHLVKLRVTDVAATALSHESGGEEGAATKPPRTKTLLDDLVEQRAQMVLKQST